MQIANFVTASVNVALYLTISAGAWLARRKVDSVRVRSLTAAATTIGVAAALGSAYKLLLIGTAIGWVPESALDAISRDWQLLQGLAGLVLGVIAGLTLRRGLMHVLRVERALGVVGRPGDHKVPGRDFGLTHRETEIVRLIQKGHLSDAELAAAAFISAATAKTHVRNILHKTGCSSRRELLLLSLDSERRSR